MPISCDASRVPPPTSPIECLLPFNTCIIIYNVYDGDIRGSGGTFDFDQWSRSQVAPLQGAHHTNSACTGLMNYSFCDMPLSLLTLCGYISESPWKTMIKKGLLMEWDANKDAIFT